MKKESTTPTSESIDPKIVPKARVLIKKIKAKLKQLKTASAAETRKKPVKNSASTKPRARPAPSKRTTKPAKAKIKTAAK